jgi:hypothetical protein
MYDRCHVCERSLGRNSVLQNMPIGRRLSFDRERGRLWVVCPRCGEWNLTPLEERWEAVEDCARRFATATVRASSAHVGLAHVSGIELLRVGGAVHHDELANWRYGPRLRRRRRRNTLLVSGAGVMGGAAVGGALLVGASSGSLVATLWGVAIPLRDSRSRWRSRRRSSGGRWRAKQPQWSDDGATQNMSQGSPTHSCCPRSSPTGSPNAVAAVMAGMTARRGTPPNESCQASMPSRHMNSTDEFQHRLQAARGTGVVRVASADRGLLGPSRELRESIRVADALARFLGLRRLGSAWRTISREEARAALAAVLTHDMAYEGECMSPSVAASFVEEFLVGFDSGAVFLTNGEFPPFSPTKPAGWRGSWTPLTEATFDTGVVAVDAARAGLLWVEDED